MMYLFKYLVQIICYAAFILLLGYFSVSPVYEHFPEDHALLKLSISHAGKIIGECRELTAEQQAGLPANMRKTQVCPRERSPLTVEILLDNKVIYHEVLPPSGLKSDGISHAYETFMLPRGSYHLIAKLKDRASLDEYNFITQTQVELQGRQVYVIDFHEKSGGFVLR